MPRRASAPRHHGRTASTAARCRRARPWSRWIAPRRRRPRRRWTRRVRYAWPPGEGGGRAHRADGTIIAMRRIGAEPRRKLLLGIAVAPAQEVDDVERAEFAEEFPPAANFRAPHGV